MFLLNSVVQLLQEPPYTNLGKYLDKDQNSAPMQLAEIQKHDAEPLKFICKIIIDLTSKTSVSFWN